ncbi:unnamed protein product [Lymnaea stagnalis]|uniref:G-protein coupled receptors family 3 profile domain-containing protein n=1 Tax=Lymnaea stagnalis TaxID=6523 RepID=A0AAV2I9N8_LYMST
MGKQWLLIFVTYIAICQGQNIVEQVCSADRMMTQLDSSSANVIIGGLFEIREKGADGLGCGKPNTANMQIFEAARYALNLLNNNIGGNRYLNGINFGMIAYDTCFSSTLAINALQALYPQSTSSNPFCQTQANAPVVSGIVGPLSSDTANTVAELAGQMPVSIVSPAAMDPGLSDKVNYRTFLRTTPSFTGFAKAVVELLIQLQWQNVLVVYVNDDNGRSGYGELLQATYNRGLCVSSALVLDDSADKATYKAALNGFGFSGYTAAILVATSGQAQVILDAVNEVPAANNVQWIISDVDLTIDQSTLNRLRGAMVVVPKFPLITGFRDYFINLETNPNNNVGNPWFKDWYEVTYKCSLTTATNQCTLKSAATLAPMFVQNPWVVPTIKAVFAYAQAIATICTNSGFCSNLRNMNALAFHNVLHNVDFTFPDNFLATDLRGQRIKFDANGDPEVSDFSIYNYNNRLGSGFVFEEIGSFTSNTLTLTRQPTLYDGTRSSVLPTNPTATCQTLGCQSCLLPQRSVTFRYQPADIVIGSLIQAHQSGRVPFTCGTGIIPRLASLVAAEWAVSRYRDINPNKLNGVTLGTLVADICPDSFVARGFLTDLLSGNNRLVDSSGNVITSETIRAFVDFTESDVAKSVSPILSNYNIPEVQTAATTPVVMNGGMTSYFSRAIPSDEVFYKAIASLLQTVGWKYVQVATRSSGIYQEMYQTFLKVAADYGICIVNTVAAFDSTSTTRFDTMLDALLSKTQTQVVVVIGNQNDVRGLLTSIGAKGKAGQLQLIAGSDMWARNPEYVRGLEAAAAGSIVLDLQMSANTDFIANLTSLSRAQIQAHPFMRELFEVSNMCSLDTSTRGLYSRTCTNLDVFPNNLYQGKTPYVIQSVFTVADKLHEVIQEVCKNVNYSGLCSDFRSATDIGLRLDAKIQDTTKTATGYGIKGGEGITDYTYLVYQQGAYTSFGQFSAENQRLTSLTPATLGTNQNKPSMCGGVCLECQYLFNMQRGLFSNGDWLIAGTFSVSDPGPDLLQPYICGATRMADGPQYTTAMLFALNQVNNGLARVSVPGVKFGGLALDHCDNPGRANLMVSGIYSGYMTNSGVDQSKILAWMTDTTASTNDAAALLDPLGVAIVSPSATAASLMEYPNFFRTIQGDRTAAQALVKIIKTFGFPYIQMVHGANEYGRGGLETMKAVTQSEGICIINAQELSTNNTATVLETVLATETHVVVLFLESADTDRFLTAVANHNVARARLVILMPEMFSKIVKRVASSMAKPIISLSLHRTTLSKYNDYINSSPISNPYFASYYMKVKSCNLPGYSMYRTPCATPLEPITGDSDYEEDNYVLATINSVYAIVNALHLTIRDICGQYTTPCAQFYTATDKLKRFNLRLKDANFIDEGQNSFRFLDREGNTAYDVWQSTSSGDYRKIGTYGGVSLDLLDFSLSSYPNVTSTCISPCLSCILRGLTFSHTPGDVYLAGMFDVHQRSLSPFTCGAINTLHGFLLLEAFHYAIKKVNEKQGQFANILTGTKLGGIGLDACNSQVRGGYLVSNIHNGLTSLARDGVVIAPSKIDTYIGSYGSKASIYLARLLTDLKIPQISYASGSEELSDQRVYPYFYRTVPSDGDQVEAMLQFLDQSDIRYVQIVYEDNSNGLTAKDTFLAEASKYRICVAQTVNFPDLGEVSSETSNSIVSKLVLKPAANTVVTFLGTDFVNSLLQAVGRSDRAQNKLRFIGSVAWADNQDAIQGADRQAVGSITLKLDSDDIGDFETYMGSKTLANSVENPWFEEYFQKIQNCYTSKANTMGYPRPCPLPTSGVISSPLYQQDSGVVYVINAVYAAAFGIHETLKEKCGEGYTAVCQAYRTSKDRHESLNNRLASVKFMDPVGNNFTFVNRSVVAGYRFLSVETGALGSVGYRQIALFDETRRSVNISSTYTTAWNSDCDRRDACAECPNIRDNDVRYVFYNDANKLQNTTTIIGFFDIHKQGVDPYRCGEINIPGLHQFLAYFYTAQKVLPGNVRILAIDTCSNSMRVDQDLFGLLQGTGLCNSDFDKSKMISMDHLGSVITLGELNTMAASRVLELPKVTYISPNALSTYLDSSRYLFRTIAPASAMVQAISNLFSKVGWKYFDALYQLNSGEGVNLWEEFNVFAANSGLCTGIALGLEDTFSSADIKLNGDKGSKAVVLFGTSDFIGRVMSAVSGYADKYVWVLAVDWDLTQDLLNSFVPAGKTVNFITVHRNTYVVESFQTHVRTALTYSQVHSTNNPSGVPVRWFDELYQTVWNCTLSKSAKPINIGKPECLTNRTFSNLVHDKYVLNTIAATFAATSGLTALQPTQSLNNLRAEIKNKIAAVTLNMAAPGSAAGDLKIFNLTTDLQFQFDKTYQWWNSGFEIKILSVSKDNSQNLAITNLLNFTVASVPSDSQLKDILRVFNLTSICTDNAGCSCSYDTDGRVLPQTGSKFTPGDHRNYFFYHDFGNLMYEWPIWAIVVAIFTSLGLLITLILFLILLFAYPKKGGTSILGYMVIIGILGIYVINFAFFVSANEATCGSRRFLMGVVYMIAFAPLLVKAVDNWRFSQVPGVEGVGRYSGISSACSLLLVACGIVLVQCIIPIIWLILVHPTASYWPVNDGMHDNWWCDPPQDYDKGIVLSMVFVMFIVLLTAIFSAITFDTERNNFESRWILFGSIATAGCFLVWMIVSTNAGPPFRDAAVTIGNLVNASLLMLVMPFRKSFLLCRSLRNKDKDDYSDEGVNGGPYENGFSNGEYNTAFDLAEYDNQYSRKNLEL